MQLYLVEGHHSQLPCPTQDQPFSSPLVKEPAPWHVLHGLIARKSVTLLHCKGPLCREPDILKGNVAREAMR